MPTDQWLEWAATVHHRSRYRQRAIIVNIHSGQEDQKRVIEFYGKKVLPRVNHGWFSSRGRIVAGNGNLLHRIVSSRYGQRIAGAKMLLGG
ncbi:MAG: hypothetical protein WCD47_15480 [Candidatus Sulfotelmatobacter sp.]